MIASVAFFSSTAARGDDRAKDQERLQNSGQVMKEVVDVPDNIPQKLLDKADCVIVIPSVLKAAFIVGGSYGRGAMTCRGRHGRRFSCRSINLLAFAWSLCGDLAGRFHTASRQ
jgi:lipid-binding SYLF domain-containing protein